MVEFDVIIPSTNSELLSSGENKTHEKAIFAKLDFPANAPVPQGKQFVKKNRSLY